MADKFDELNKSVGDLLSSVKELRERQKERDESVEKLINGTKSDVGGSASHNSFERRILNAFGCRDAKDLMHTNVCADRYKNIPDEYKAHVLQLKSDIDVARMTQQILGGQPTDKAEITDENIKRGQVARVKGILESDFGRSRDIGGRLKAFNTTDFSEYIPTAVSSIYVDELELEKRVHSMIQEIRMPSNPYKLSVRRGLNKGKRVDELAAVADSAFTAESVTLDAVSHAEYYPISEELNEDSAPSILTMARQDVGRALVRGYESAIINGSDGTTGGTDIDADFLAAAATIPEKFWPGFKKLAFDNGAFIDLNALDAGALGENGLKTMRAAMGKYGVNPRELMWVVSPVGLQQALLIDAVKTVDVFTSQATVVTGTLVNYQGIPVVCAEECRDDVSASGWNAGAGNTFTQALLINRQRAFKGVRRPIRVRAQARQELQYDMWQVVAHARWDFKMTAQSASEIAVVCGYNIDTTA